MYCNDSICWWLSSNLVRIRYVSIRVFKGLSCQKKEMKYSILFESIFKKSLSVQYFLNKIKEGLSILAGTFTFSQDIQMNEN